MLLGASFIALLSAVLVPRPWQRPFAATVAGLGSLGGLVTSVWLYVDSAGGHRVIADAFYRDRWTAPRAGDPAARRRSPPFSCGAEQIREHDAEFFALLLASAAGMTFFVGAANLMTLFLSLEWFSIALYILCAIDSDKEGSLEAGLKYLVVGSFGSAALLFGSALVYGATGRIGFAEIARRRRTPHDLAARARARDDHRRARLQVVGGAVPHVDAGRLRGRADDRDRVHVVGDEGGRARAHPARAANRVPAGSAPVDVGARGIAVASLVIGNFAALVQRNVKRLLAYSSISHAGFMLIGVASGTALGGRAVLYYLIPYSAMAFGSFAIVAARERELGAAVTLDNLAGFGWERPFLGVAMWFFMFGFAGLPLGGGFVGKFYVFAAAYEHGWTWLVIVGVLATLVSLYYYLGVVRAIYMRPSAELARRGRLAAAGRAPARRGRRGARRVGRVAVRGVAADHAREACRERNPLLSGKCCALSASGGSRFAGALAGKARELLGVLAEGCAARARVASPSPPASTASANASRSLRPKMSTWARGLERVCVGRDGAPSGAGARPRPERLEQPREHGHGVEDERSHDGGDRERRHGGSLDRRLAHGRAEHEQEHRQRGGRPEQPPASRERVAQPHARDRGGDGEREQDEPESEAVEAGTVREHCAERERGCEQPSRHW